MIFMLGTPMTCAASTNSFSLRLSTMPRTTLATPIQPMSDNTVTIPKYTQVLGQLGGTMTASASHSGILGNDLRSSVKRWMPMSTHPP